MSENSRPVIMNNDQSAVLSGKIHINMIDPADTHFSAAQRFTADRIRASALAGNMDIHSVWMNVRILGCLDKAVGNTSFFCNGKSLWYTLVVC